MNGIILPQPLDIAEQERHILLDRRRVDILEDARRHYILSPKVSKISGPWNDDYTPYIRRPVSLLQNPPVRIWISASRQTGKSTLVGLLLDYIVRNDPSPIGIVLPQENVAKNRMRKFRTLFESSPQLLERLGGDVRRLNIGEPTDLGDMIIYPCWSSSIATLSDNSIRVMVYDEVVLFDILPDGENPIESGRDRQQTWQETAIELGVSSPGVQGDLHDQQMRAGSDEFWYVPCPLPGCGRWHELRTFVDENDERYIVLDRPAPNKYYSPTTYERSPRLSRYVCPHCGRAWSEADRWHANLEGVYISHHQEIMPDGSRGKPRQSMDASGAITGPPPEGPQYSFNWHMMMAYPKFAPVSAMAAQYVRAVNGMSRGDKSSMKRWVRAFQSKPWKEEAKVIHISDLELKKNNYPAGVVPNDVQILVAGADYHRSELGQVRIDYLVKGFAPDLRNYDILYGHAGSLEEMFRATTIQSFPWAEPCDKPELMLSCGFIDSGYQPEDLKNEIVDEVYQFCRRYWRLRIWYPIKGGPNTQTEMFRITPLDRVVEQREKRYRRKYAHQYVGMELITLAVVQLKDLVAAWAEAPMGAPASTSYNRDMPPEFFAELGNEYKGKNEDGKWGWWPKERGLPTHALDASCYATAAGYYRRVNEIWSEGEIQKIEQALKERNIQPVRVRLSEKPRRRL